MFHNNMKMSYSLYKLHILKRVEKNKTILKMDFGISIKSGNKHLSPRLL